MEARPCKAIVFTIMLSVLALQLGVQAQLPEPEVTFIPDQLSAESSFAMLADPGSVGGSVRITWITDEGYGHFPYMEDSYMCYFSDTDYQSTCGPSPFRYATGGTPYLLDVFTFDSDGNQGNATIEVEIGGLKIIPDVTIDFDSDVVNMLVYTTPSIADSMSYKVFDSGFDAVSAGYVSMSRITATPYYNSSVELDSGVYYIAFKASSDDDFGGGMIKVDTTGGGDTEYDGILQADAIDIDVLVQSGSQPTLPQNKRIINPHNQTFEGVTVTLPDDISSYVTITIPNSTIEPYESVYYTINLHSISSSLGINTEAEIRSGDDTLLGAIPISMDISYAGGSTSPDCSVLSDGEDCLGGICCSGVCRKKAECCSSSDCGYGESCSSYRCAEGTADSCSTGTCRSSCLTGEESTGEACSSGVCCIESDGECSGKSDLSTCTGGICCNEVCITTSGADCCSSFDCLDDEFCISNVCQEAGSGDTGTTSGGMDYLTIIIIIAIVAAAGAGAWWFLKKRKAKTPEERFEEESKKEEDVFDEEEFY